MATYLPPRPAKILEIGAQNVNGTLRDHAPRNAEYTGLDFEEGDGVDLVVTGVTDWNVPDEQFDLVMASSVFEHDKAFWRTFLAMCAKTKPGGHLYVSAPSNGTVHRYPQDYWRFYPDSGLALEEWARSEGFDVDLVESFVAERETEVWNDFCAVFRRGPTDAALNRDFVCLKVACTNALTWRSSTIINPVEDAEDTRLLRAAREETQHWMRHSDHIVGLHGEELQRRSERLSELTAEIERQTRRIMDRDGVLAANEQELAVVRARAGELATELERLHGEMQAQAVQLEQQTHGLMARDAVVASKEEELAGFRARAEQTTGELQRLAADAQAQARELEQRTILLAAHDAASLVKDEELAAIRAHADQAARELERLDAEMRTQVQDRDAQVRQLADAMGELQSRLAQREEEAAQAWAAVDDRTVERDRLAAEGEKAKTALIDAKGWVEKLALTRTRMEGRIAALESDLAKLRRDSAKAHQRNQELVERIDALTVRTSQGRSTADQPLKAEDRRAENAPTVSRLNERTADQELLKRDLARCREELEASNRERDSVKQELTRTAKYTERASSDTDLERTRLQECYKEMAMLGDMIAAAQDSIAELKKQNEWLRKAGQFLAMPGDWWWRFVPTTWQRRRRDQRLREQELFDPQGYLDRYPDVSASGQDPLRHFLNHGIIEHRRPR